MNALFSSRLKQARIMQGLSMDALCEKAGNALSKQSISKYETGKMMPDSKSLIILANALGLSVDYFFRPLGVVVERVEFRKKSKLGKKQELAIKEVVKDNLERYFEIESFNDIKSEFKPICRNVLIQSEDDVFSFVTRIKSEWKLGEDGINNLIEILEENQIKVIEIDAPNSFDGLSGYVNDKNPFIVLNRNCNSERKRFTALHELGHLILTFDSSIDQRGVEQLCHLFASEMLISKDVFIQRIGLNRKDISLQELQDIQIQFGISIDALMHKAWALNIVTESRYKTFHIKKNRNQQFKEEVDRSRYKTEQTNRFVRLVYRALASEIISISKAGVLLNVPVGVVRNQLSLV
ncbi:MAG: XRE family transcriptional regulator [Bacteroidales bacterium]|nr:XRE family transcriptional regulator [Bacteroidales bacterium]